MNPIQSRILCLVFGVLLCTWHGIAFAPNNPLFSRVSAASTTNCQNWLGDLWEEIIEFSTYGPAERAMLKAQREKEAASAKKSGGEDVNVSMDSFQRAQQKYVSKTPEGDSRGIGSSSPSSPSEDTLSIEAFQAVVLSSSVKENSDEDVDFDGYKLRDMLVEKWGVPLDVDFQRGYGGGTVYCTVLPVAFGSRRCRHETELDYLMHLQAVIDILRKYDNLDPFIFFVQKTDKQPKPGVESAPYLMQLTKEQLKKIL